MNMTFDLGINLLAGLIGFCVAWIWRWSRTTLRLRHGRRFWKPYTLEGSQIVLGRFSEFTPFESTGLVGLGDAIALSELRDYLGGLGLREYQVTYADRLTGEDLASNLVLLGGPDANSITKEILANIRTTIRFGNPEIYEIAMYDTKSSVIYAPLRDPDTDELVRDYGLIVRSANPYGPSKHVLVLAGSYGFGTMAAARYATSKEFLEDPIVANAKAIECVVSADIVRDEPLNLRLVAVREL